MFDLLPPYLKAKPKNAHTSKLQNESLHVDDLKTSYLQATLYLEHCENLLNTIEQEVVEIDIDESPL